MKFLDKKVLGIFAGGVLFGTAGIKALSSRDAKNCYVGITAAALRIKDFFLDTAQTVQENAEDIYEEAKRVNALRDEDYEFEPEDDIDEEDEEEERSCTEVSEDDTPSNEADA